jgi:hypothetical protein
MKAAHALRLVVTLAVAAALPACATIQVKTDHDHTVDFSRYHTFEIAGGRVVRAGIGDTGNTLVSDRISRALVQNLAAHGLAPVHGDADLAVRFVAGTQIMQEIERIPVPGGYGTNYAWPAYPAYGDVWVSDYERETLVIDLVDRATNRVVWHAVAVADTQDFSSPELVNKAVAKALASYPPRA